MRFSTVAPAKTALASTVAPARWSLEVHFEHFWTLVPKSLPDGLWRFILTISRPCSQNRSQAVSEVTPFVRITESCE